VTSQRRPHLYTKLTNAKPRDSPVSRSYAMYIREMGPKALKSSCSHKVRRSAQARRHAASKMPAVCACYGLGSRRLEQHTRRSSSRVSSDRLVTRTLFSSRLCMESPIVAPPPAARALHMRGVVASAAGTWAHPQQMQVTSPEPAALNHSLEDSEGYKHNAGLHPAAPGAQPPTPTKEAVPSGARGRKPTARRGARSRPWRRPGAGRRRRRRPRRAASPPAARGPAPPPAAAPSAAGTACPSGCRRRCQVV
jgi:hypothetical protein